jgi:glycosyltransferase involved in cell wall biosynthesis
MVVSIHDVIVTWYPESLDDPYVRYCRQVTRRVVRQAARILTVSEWSRREILERFAADPAKVRVFYNGVHPDFLVDAPGGGRAARQRWADDEPYVLTIGSPLPRKNTGRLLDALGRLRRRQGFDHRLLVTGLRDSAPFEAIAASAGLADRVRFLPYVPRQELVELYAGADLTVYPSIVEGWGIPVIESLAQGTPVVTSDSSGMREAGGEHATYFDPTDAEQMAERIGQALERRGEFAAIRDAARARARGFTWRRAAEVTLAAYREVAGR